MIAVPEARLVAERRAADAAFELGDQLGGKAVREDGKRPVEDQPHQLPVPGHRILARRRLRHPAEGAERRAGRAAPPSSTTRPRPSERSVGSASGTAVGDVAERVAAAIAVTIGVGQLADADAVEDDEDDPAGNGRLRQAGQASCVE